MFEKLATANADRYNNHPTQHATIMVAYGVVATVVARKAIKKFLIKDLAK